MKNVLSTLKSVLADIAKLHDPKVAAAVVALGAELLAPLFGASVGSLAPTVTGVLVAVGVLVSFLEKSGASGAPVKK